MTDPELGKGPGGSWGAPEGQVPPYYPPPMPPRRPTNSMAMVSLIIGIVSLVSCQLLGIVSIWLGNRARAEIRQTGEDGDGMALAGIIIGWCAVALVALSVILIVGYFIVVGVFVAGSGAANSGY